MDLKAPSLDPFFSSLVCLVLSSHLSHPKCKNVWTKNVGQKKVNIHFQGLSNSGFLPQWWKKWRRNQSQLFLSGFGRSYSTFYAPILFGSYLAGPILRFMLLFYVLCLTKNITELIVDIYCHADLVSLCRWSLEGQSRVLS